jgi:hypothetical protein
VRIPVSGVPFRAIPSPLKKAEDEDEFEDDYDFGTSARKEKFLSGADFLLAYNSSPRFLNFADDVDRNIDPRVKINNRDTDVLTAPLRRRTANVERQTPNVPLTAAT